MSKENKQKKSEKLERFCQWQIPKDGEPASANTPCIITNMFFPNNFACKYPREEIKECYCFREPGDMSNYNPID